MPPAELDALIRRRFRVVDDDLPPYRGLKYPGSRETLAGVMCEAGFSRGAEVGVLEGVFSETLCRAIPGLQLLCIDPWAPYSSGPKRKLSGAQADASYQAAMRRLAPYAGVTVVREASMEVVAAVPPRSLDFVYIDGDHEFDATMLDLIHWSQRVRHGGIVAGHDYGVAYRVGVVRAVDAYAAAHDIRSVYITRDNPPGYFWVNP